MKDDPPHTYNPPERFEEHWNEYLDKPGMFDRWYSPLLLFVVFVGACLWGVIIYIAVRIWS